MKTIYASIDRLEAGKIYGHHELELTEEAFEVFQSYSLEQQHEWIECDGILIIDDYDIDYIGDITKIEIT
jgi:hypothetical protein